MNSVIDASSKKKVVELHEYSEGPTNDSTDLCTNSSAITINDPDNYFKKRPWKLGNVYVLLWIGEFPVICIGPHWPYYLCLNTIIVGICGAYFYYLKDLMLPTAWNIGFLLFLCQNICYSTTALFNPGIPYYRFSKEFNPKSYSTENVRYCNECMIIQDLNLDVSHCPDCNICVEGHDHHCPWTGKCIGKYTLWSFYGFVFGTLALFVFLLFGLIFIQPHKKAN